MNIDILPSLLGIVCLDPKAELPTWALSQNHFLSITYTEDELSIVCDQQHIPDDVLCERDWRALKIVGPLDFSLVGILAPIATLLAQHNIPIFVLSTFDTDYILVKDRSLSQTKDVLQEADYIFV